MLVTVVFAPAARQTLEVSLNLEAPCSLLEALQHSGLLRRFPEIIGTNMQLGVWGRKAEADQLLRDRDRIEIYRELRVDPKVARRERFVKQGARTTGLFVKQRPGGKAGY